MPQGMRFVPTMVIRHWIGFAVIVAVIATFAFLSPRTHNEHNVFRRIPWGIAHARPPAQQPDASAAVSVIQQNAGKNDAQAASPADKQATSASGQSAKPVAAPPPSPGALGSEVASRSSGGNSGDAVPQPSATATRTAASTRDYGLNTGLGPAPDNVTRDTPRACLQGFFEATDRNDNVNAAHYLHLWGVSRNQQKTQGPVLAQKLGHALRQAVGFDFDQVPDTSTGTDDPSDKPITEVKIATVELPDATYTIRLSRQRDSYSNNMVWVFSSGTVRSIKALDDALGLPPYVQDLPTWLRTNKHAGLLAYQWIGLIVLTVAAWVIGFIARYPAVWIIRHLMRRGDEKRSEQAATLSRGVIHWFVTFVVLLAAYPVLRVPASASQQIHRIIITCLTVVIMVGAMRALTYGVQALERIQASYNDPIRLRAAITRLNALKRAAQVLIIIVGTAIALMQYPTARTIGLSLLGSAGIAGAIIGFAAQKTFSNLFAGFLISFTQPIRIGDTVIVENEYGTIEEIAYTHVIVQIWDNRRLVVPVTYFLDHPFENWTKTSPKLTGTVMLYADYRVNVQRVRERLDEILQANPLFDGLSKNLIVHDITENATILRASMSANNPDDLFTLRYQVREELLAFLQSEPDQLPLRRIESKTIQTTQSPAN